MQQRIWQFLDLNAGRIRYDYIERLQSSMTQFEKDLAAAVTMVTESLRSALHKRGNGAQGGNGNPGFCHKKLLSTAALIRTNVGSSNSTAAFGASRRKASAWGVEKRNCGSLRFAPPDFLLNLVDSASFMRLSSRKAADAVLSTAAQQEIRVRSGRDDKPLVGNWFARADPPAGITKHELLRLPLEPTTLPS